MGDPLQTTTSTLARECCICSSPITIMGAQALSMQTPWGEFRVFFHSTCFLVSPQKAHDALNFIVNKNKK